jgi:hypothetical protein
MSEEFADRTVPRIVRHGHRSRLARMRVSQLDIRGMPGALRSAAVTTVARGTRRTRRQALPSMQTRTPLERDQMRGEHQPEHGMLSQTTHQGTNEKTTRVGSPLPRITELSSVHAPLSSEWADFDLFLCGSRGVRGSFGGGMRARAGVCWLVAMEIAIAEEMVIAKLATFWALPENGALT